MNQNFGVRSEDKGFKGKSVLKVTLQTRAPKISASVDGGLSRGSRVRRPGSEDPHRR